MGAVVVPSRLNTPRAHSATSDPTTSSDTAAGFRVGDIWVNTATGNIWKCYDATAGAAKWRFEPRVLGIGRAAALTGTTDETALATITVPANAMGANGVLRIETHWLNNNSGNNKTARARFSTISGTQFVLAAVTTTLSWRDVHLIANAGATNSQTAHTTANQFGTSSNAAVTASVDTTAATTLILSGQLANGGDSLTLNYYVIELLRPDIS